jgi:class 3 adenylate cyclase
VPRVIRTGGTDVQSSYSAYEFEKSFQRLADILNQSDVEYEEVHTLPDRSKLTFTNGYYAYCSALFVDIRDSSSFPKKYRRPTIARIYRAYISEMVAVMVSDPDCREVNIVGDGVWCVVNTPNKPDIDFVFGTAARANSLVKVLNYRLSKKSLSEIRVGIGVSYGRALMIKAGYAGSGINEVVYMGDVVNEAAKLAAYANSTYSDKALMVSSLFHQNLSDHNKGLLSQNSARSCWHGNVVNTAMEEWYDANRV